MPDLDLRTADGPVRVFALLHDARPVLLNLGEPGALDVGPWADRVQLVDAEHVGAWELPALGAVTAPSAVLIRPDGHVAWVGEGGDAGLTEALSTWFGPPAASRPSPGRGELSSTFSNASASSPAMLPARRGATHAGGVVG
jgi:3-(3-hydroxy-phenyl)propionate hydroxylase